MRFSFSLIALGLLFTLSACNNYKPQAGGLRKNQTTTDTNPGGPSGSVLAASGSQVILAHAKLLANPGEYKAKITYGSNPAIEVKFTPGGNESKIPLTGISAGDQQLLVIELYKGDELRFIAKKANVSIAKAEATSVVVDDCLVLTAPWEGKAHDGSCEWSIQDVN